jgi:hypothetical protein
VRAVSQGSARFLVSSNNRRDVVYAELEVSPHCSWSTYEMALENLTGPVGTAGSLIPTTRRRVD